MRRRFQVETESFDLELTQTDLARFRVSRTEVADSELIVEVLRDDSDSIVLSINHSIFEFKLNRKSSDTWEISHAGRTFGVASDAWTGRKASDSRAPARTTLVLAPMPGRIVEVRAAVGARIEQGASVVVIEAMKMQNELFAASAGEVTQIWVKPGDIVETGASLVEIRK
jgi:biotin carboxyl carrier protein